MNIKSLIYWVLEYFKWAINFFIPGYFSDNCRSVKRIIKHNNLKIKTVYDIGAFKGMWYKERKKTFPNQASFYLFDAQNLIESKNILNEVTFINTMLANEDNQDKNFWMDGGSGSSYYKELGNDIWDNVTPKLIKSEKLDSVIMKKQLPLPNYIKIDTQGSELDVLKGFSENIHYEKLYFIELEISLYQINSEAPLIEEVIQYISDKNFLLISLEKLPIVPYFGEKKLIQINGIFARQNLTSVGEF